MYPVRGCVYTLDQIVKILDLADSPHLMFFKEGKAENVQTSHLTFEELLELPAWAATRWKYIRKTSEWCEIFHYEGTLPIEQLLYRTNKHYGQDDIIFCPKGEGSQIALSLEYAAMV